jgi:hypothetical protein
MARTGKYTGLISTVSWTPNGGTLVSITGNIGAKPTINNQLIEFTGDAATFATLLANVKGTRGLQLSGYDVSKLMKLSTGPGTLVVTVNDAVNGTGTGAITYTLSNAVKQDASGTHQNQSADSATLSFVAYSSDGTTDPLVITEAT